ncbi:DUF6491 family protein [Caulobacter sp.]|uniref:DUF6491 family protein n=1 Tax=Caulobacter sp. TaxID=78 RepID=UPI003BACBB4C
MKPALFIGAALMAFSSVPAMADNGQVFDEQAQLRAYSSTIPADGARRCFNGKFITGANRAGGKTLYVQSTQRMIYRVRLAEGCDALQSAEKVSLRANGGDVVCSGDAAEMIAQTAAGPKRCRVSDVRRLTSGEVTALATAPRR